MVVNDIKRKKIIQPTSLTDSQHGTILQIIGDKRKRQHSFGIEVRAANEHDSRSGFRMLERLKGRFERLKKIYADGGYRGELIDKVRCSSFPKSSKKILSSDALAVKQGAYLLNTLTKPSPKSSYRHNHL